MVDSVADVPRCHVLLIGIDDYPIKPLRGCVNDVDALRELLVDRARLPAAQIRRLASPLNGGAQPLEQRATAANIRAALAELASDKVAPGDRVLVAVSCHGTRVQTVTQDGQRFHREALVPVDVDDDAGGRTLLFDHELNVLLRAIAARTTNLAVVLDCCNAAGVTRGSDDTLTSRSLDPVEDLGLRAPIAIAVSADTERAVGRGLIDCHVVTACLAHEQAQEGGGADGHQGLLTRALVAALRDVAPEQLWATSWSAIWSRVRDEIEDRNPAQHPWMSGSAARHVLAGPPVEGDAGFEVVRVAGSDRYRLGAGELFGVTKDATIAVYAEGPAFFPALGTPEDLRVRVGLVRVDEATRSRAIAEATGPAFDPPPGARGRLVGPGKPAKLRYAVVPADAAMVKRLDASPLLESVEPARAQVRLERRDDRWLLVDDVHGVGGMPPLVALLDGELEHARVILEHYLRYALPLRIAALATDLPGALELAALACPPGDIDPDLAQEGNLPEAALLATATYDLVDGQRVCFRVRNRSPKRLRVTFVNSAASGKVQLLGDTVIDASRYHVFWAGEELGQPFHMSVPRGAPCGIDRVTVIGRTTMSADLSQLRLDVSFADHVPRLRSIARGIEDRDLGAGRATPPAEQWTATQAIAVTRGAR